MRSRPIPTVGVVIPTRTTGDPWREKALEWVRRWYAEKHPELPVVLGEIPEDDEWSKGAAVAGGIEQLGPVDVLVLADGDSVILEPEVLSNAIHLVSSGRASWIVPHRIVYRLREAETARLHADPAAKPRPGAVVRTPYAGPAGGGITVLSSDAFRRVGGIDRRFLGWGGEDVAFGWALATVVAPVTRLQGRLLHLWHPHPAPDLRGSPASEALVARWREARGYPRRMAEMIETGEWTPRPPLPEPVRFRMTANRRTVRLFGSETVIQFRDGIYETDDPDTADALRQQSMVREERR